MDATDNIITPPVPKYTAASDPFEKPPRRHKDKKRWRIRYLFEGEWHEARQGYASEGSARDAIRTFQQKKHRLYPKGWRGPTVRIDAVDGLMIKNNLTGETVTLNVC